MKIYREKADRMLVKEYSGRIYNISADLPQQEIEMAKAYIRDAVITFCQNNPGQSFAVRDLFGGENRDWRGTPLQAIYEYHAAAGAANPRDNAGKDVGKLMKIVLSKEDGYYIQSQSGKTKLYRKVN